MNKKKLIMKIIVRAIILMILSATMFLIFENAVVSNNIMLGQMSNSDETYLLIEYYNRVKAVASTIYGCISAFIVGITIYDIYKFIKNKGEKLK